MLLDDPAAVKDFQREARNIARLEHPHVVTIYDVHEQDGRLFIVMQLVDGASLEARITRQGRLSWRDLAPLMAGPEELRMLSPEKSITARGAKISFCSISRLASSSAPPMALLP